MFFQVGEVVFDYFSLVLLGMWPYITSSKRSLSEDISDKCLLIACGLLLRMDVG